MAKSDIYSLNQTDPQFLQQQPTAAGQGRFANVVGRISKAITGMSEQTSPGVTEEYDVNLEGTEEERSNKLADVLSKIQITFTEINERRIGKIQVLRDMYENNLTKYTNVFGMLELNKVGHVRAQYNYLSQIVDKLTNFLTSKPPYINIPARQVDDPVEVERANSIRYFLDKVHHQNRFKYFFKRSAHLQALFGDTFIYGPYWDPDKKKICYEWIEDIGNVHIGWKDNRFEQMDWFAIERLQSIESLKKKYNLEDVAPYEGLVASGTYPMQSPTKRWTDRTDKQTFIQQAKETVYWDEETMVVFINDSDIVQYVKHEYGFVPFWKVENIHVDDRPWGKSDIDELIDANVELIERMGDAGDSIRQGAVPRFKVINDPNFDTNSIKAGANGQFVFVEGDKADVGPLKAEVNIAPYEMYMKNIMQFIYDLGLPAVAWGGHSAAVTGRALDMQYQAITDKIENKRIVWEMALEILNERILILAEKYISGMKKIIDGHYIVEFDWEEVLPKSMSETITNVSNKRDRGIISFHTALKELGYKDPDAEIDLIIQEWSDPKLAPILGKNALLTEGIQKSIEDVFGRPGAIPIPPKTSINLTGDLTPEQESAKAAQLGLGQSMGAQGRFANNIPPGAEALPEAKYPTFTEVSMDGGDNSQSGTPTSPGVMQPYQNQSPQPMSAPGVSVAGQTSPDGSVAQVSQNLQAGGK